MASDPPAEGTAIDPTAGDDRTAIDPAGDDRTAIDADGADVVVIAVSTVDAQGRHVPTANQLVKFEITGGRIIGVGNGDPSCHESDKASERSLFNGYAQVIVQASRDAGPIKLTAKADGVAPADVTLSVQ